MCSEEDINIWYDREWKHYKRLSSIDPERKEHKEGDHYVCKGVHLFFYPTSCIKRFRVPRLYVHKNKISDNIRYDNTRCRVRVGKLTTSVIDVRVESLGIKALSDK